MPAGSPSRTGGSMSIPVGGDTRHCPFLRSGKRRGQLEHGGAGPAYSRVPVSYSAPAGVWRCPTSSGGLPQHDHSPRMHEALPRSRGHRPDDHSVLLLEVRRTEDGRQLALPFPSVGLLPAVCGADHPFGPPADVGRSSLSSGTNGVQSPVEMHGGGDRAPRTRSCPSL